MKEYYFFTSMPRAGNTLLGTLINQNPNLCLTPNSIVPGIIWDLESIKNTMNYANFLNEEAFNNVQKNVIHNYYKDYKANKILERGCWSTPDNYQSLKNYITDKPKFIILYRPLVECLASFMKAKHFATEDDLWDFSMSHSGGFLNMACSSISSVINNNDEHIFITYNDLVDRPVNTIKRIYDFIGEKYVSVKTEDFNQFSVNGIEYDDSMLSSDLHTINTKKIINKRIVVEDYLSKDFIKKANKYDITVKVVNK
jgi:hypothetical protein|tara:strand:- start:1361 stop:2125 length:765 start_codon:yes stop_codon:yes gene_type:complete